MHIKYETQYFIIKYFKLSIDKDDFYYCLFIWLIWLRYNL